MTAISNSPQPVSVTSYGGCVYSLMGLSKLGCNWKTAYNADVRHTDISCIKSSMQSADACQAYLAYKMSQIFSIYRS